jgi:hypothetical protein
MQRFEFLRQPLLGELAMSPERKRERKKERKREKTSTDLCTDPRPLLDYTSYYYLFI